MKFKRFIAMLLVFAMTLSYLPGISFVQATDNVLSESSILTKTDSNIQPDILDKEKPELILNQPDILDKEEPELILNQPDILDKEEPELILNQPNTITSTEINAMSLTKNNSIIPIEKTQVENIDSPMLIESKTDELKELTVDVSKTIESESEDEEITVLTDKVTDNDFMVHMTFPIGSGLTEESRLNVSVSEPDSDQMWAAMGQYDLLSVLDYLVLDISTESVSDSNNVTVDIEFNKPYLKALSFNDVYFVEFKGNEPVKPLDSFAGVDDNGLITELSFKLTDFESETRVVMISTDQPNLSAWKDYSSSYCIGAQNYGSNLSNYAIGGSGNGRLTYHCYASSDSERDMNDFAICLNNLLYFRGGTNTATVTASSTGERDWADFSRSLKEKLILLLAYGMDEDSSYARFTDEYACYAAMQLVAWEWIRDVRETAFTVGGEGYEGTSRQYYSDEVVSIAETLRYLVKNNPDNIDPYATKVILIWPDSSSGQPLLAIEEEPVVIPKEGHISVEKAITGSGTLSGWIFELYGSRTDANNRTNRIATAKTNANGVATFKNLDADTRYYVREAPASVQTNTTTGWTIPTTVLGCTVVGNTTTSAGTITNTGPAKISVTKKITPSSQATSANLSGWVFELYNNQANAQSATSPIKTATTNTSGIAYFDNLEAGTYYVREAPASRQTKTLASWTLSSTVLTVTANAGVTNYTSAGSITNAAPVSLSITKKIIPSSDATSANLQNWRFEIYSTKAAANAAGTNYLSYAYTNTSGVATFNNLIAGKTYYIREAPVSRQDKRTNLDKWSISTEVFSGSAPAGSTSAVSVGSATNYSGGSLSVTKNISTAGDYANNKANWKFELYETEANAKAGTNYIASAYTNANGVAKFDGLIHQKNYFVREAPISRQDKQASATGWILDSTVLSGTVTAGETLSLGSVSNTAPGSLSVTKSINTKGDLVVDKNNWRFELYLSQSDANSGSGYIDYAYTDINGIATFNNLTNGIVYYVKEAPASRQNKWNTTGWGLSVEVKSGTVIAGATTSVGTVTNAAPAQITGIKSMLTESGTSGKLNGWVYQIATDANFSKIISTVTSGTNGSWETEFNLPAGTYYVREAPMSNQTRSDKNNFVLDTSVVTVTVAAGESGKAYKSNQNYTNQNSEKGRIQVKKNVFGIEATSSTLNNWVFNVYSDKNCSVLVTSITTGANGTGTSILLTPGNYWIKEAPQSEQIRNDIYMWALSEDVIPVTVRAGATINAYNANSSTVTNFYGKYIRLTKVSNDVQNPDCYEQIKDNNMYTLAGAQYQIIVNDSVEETIITDANGIAISGQIYTVGTTGIIKEIVAPDGYLLDTTEYTFTIEATTEEYCEVRVSDIPTFDPQIRRFQKVDSETGIAQGNTTFEGAVFKYEYFDNTDWSGTPVRTWHFETDANGLHVYHPDYLASGYNNDEVYKSPNNIYELPLGSVKITEIVSPLGYKKLPVLYATITQSAMGERALFNYTAESLAILKTVDDNMYTGEEPENSDLLGKLSIQKLDKDFNNTPLNWATFEGCEFTIYNKSDGPVKIGDFTIAQPNEVCYVLTVDAEGKASTDCIFPIGTYEIRETKGNDYYQCNSEWNKTFTIDGSATNPLISIECKNTMKPATIKLQKINTGNEPLAGSKFLLEYSIDGQTDWQPVFKSDNIVVGGCSSENLTNDGCLIIPENGEIAFEGLYPVIYYKITEVEAPNGYQLLKDPIIIDSQVELTSDNNFETGYRIVNNESFAMPKTGATDFWMFIPCFFFASLAMFYVTYVMTLPTVQKKRKNT